MGLLWNGQPPRSPKIGALMRKGPASLRDSRVRRGVWWKVWVAAGRGPGLWESEEWIPTHRTSDTSAITSVKSFCPDALHR